jgi:hypothetical protein
MCETVMLRIDVLESTTIARNVGVGEASCTYSASRPRYLQAVQVVSFF